MTQSRNADQQLEADVILQHARWVYEVLQLRIDSLNQRAGLLLATAFGVAAIGVPLVAQNLSTLPALVSSTCLIPLAVTIAFSFAVLKVRMAHDVGSKMISRVLSEHDTPTGDYGPDISEALLDTLIVAPNGQSESALVGVEQMADSKGRQVARAQWWLVATFIPIAATSLVAILEGITKR